MRVLIWIISIFALAVGMAMLVSPDWGMVHFLSRWWHLGMPLKYFVVLLLAAFFVGYLLVRLIRNTLALPEVVGQWRERRRRQRADRSLREALMTFHEGRYAQALRHAEKAYGASDHPATAMLLAARAAHALRDDARYRKWIERLADEGEKVQTARLMTEAELAVVSHDFEEAARKLEMLRQDGRHVAALRLSLRVASALKRWDEVIRLTRQLRKHKALTEDQVRPLLCRAHLECLRECAGDGEALIDIWEDIPSAEREDRQLVAGAVPLFAQAGRGHVVRRTLEHLLDDEWNSDLARLYGFCGNDSACLATGENWLKKHEDDPGLLFALGRLCAASQLWGKAESYFSASLGLKPAVDTHLALARLFDRIGRELDAQQHYRAAAEMAAG